MGGSLCVQLTLTLNIECFSWEISCQRLYTAVLLLRAYTINLLLLFLLHVSLRPQTSFINSYFLAWASLDAPVLPDRQHISVSAGFSGRAVI